MQAFCCSFLCSFRIPRKNYKVQPDLIVICDKKGLKEQNYTGVPTLVVEVLSPSTASKDFTKKMELY